MTLNDYEIVRASTTSLEIAAARLRAGELVAFPTETVYGLGASALNADAIEKIFRLKERPHSDPLIVHVSSLEMAYSLCSLSSISRRVFDVLATSFWPGPLTIVVPASERVPKIVMAGGNTVGIRCPAHPLAIELISRTNLPVAAPSANKFGHVSPTTALHVAEDLGRDGLMILDGGQCAVGIESTVMKIVSDKECVILRRGAVSAEAISSVLSESGLLCEVSVRNRFVSDKVAMDSPGELLIHYAPIVPAYLIKNVEQEEPFFKELNLSDCALIDVGGRFQRYQEYCAYSVDLSETSNMLEACERLFFVLREVEKKPFVKAILVPDLSKEDSELAKAIGDRLNRATALKQGYLFNRVVRVDA
jgi:tRNA threonylcarbamoyl adenosine modification protein (Sua5/YciO/YrdC/YwlC family)